MACSFIVIIHLVSILFRIATKVISDIAATVAIWLRSSL